MELVTPASIDEVISVLKKEIVKTQTGDVEKTTEYRQMLVQVLFAHSMRMQRCTLDALLAWLVWVLCQGFAYLCMSCV